MVCPFVFLHLAIIVSALLRITANRIGDVMVSELASSAVDREFEPRSYLLFFINYNVFTIKYILRQITTKILLNVLYSRLSKQL
jgi:hypothetical protein